MAKKQSWDKRYQSIKKSYPLIDDPDWNNAISDDDTFIKVLGDILKSERKISTPGKRPSLNKSDGIEKLNRILERDYSDSEFCIAFKNLVGQRSVRAINAKTGLSKSHVQRLLTGADDPSIETMEKIATAFRKHPSYFLEYRSFKVLQSINDFLIKNPETATTWYKKVWG
jgi:transcriptional regulator with XRE-family HTH domain